MVDVVAPVWGRWIDNNGGELATDIKTDANGNIYVSVQGNSGNLQAELTAVTDAKLGSVYGALILKYNPSGVPIWGRWIDGLSIDKSTEMKVDAAGNVYVVGYCADVLGEIATVLGPKPGSGTAAFLIKYNTTGTPLWGKWIDGSGSDVGMSIALDTSGNVYVTGNAGSELQSEIVAILGAKPGGGAGIFIIQYTSSGVALWGRWIDSVNTDNAIMITTDTLDNLYIAGTASGDLQADIASVIPATPLYTNRFILKFNSSHVPLWGKWIDTVTSAGGGITVDTSGNLYVTGNCQATTTSLGSEWNGIMSSKPSGIMDAFLIKYNSSGAPQWGKWIEGSAASYGQRVVVDAINNVYMVGYASSDLQPELATLMGTKPGASSGGFLLKYNSSGVAQWGRWLDGNSSDQAISVTIDTTGSIFVIGNTTTYDLLTPELVGVLDSKPGGTNQGTFFVKYTSATAPDAPTNATAIAGDQQVTVSFNTPTNNGGSNITEYRIYSGGIKIGYGNSSPITVSGLTNGTAYTFTVVAVNANGESLASSATTPVIPSASFSWYDLLPDLNPNGTPLSNPAINANGARYYRHAFSTGLNSSVKVFIRYNEYAYNSDVEFIKGVYKVGSSTNLLGGTTYVSSISGSISHNTTNGTLNPSVASNYENTSETPNAVLLLEASSSYYIISKTNYNDSPTGDYYGPYEFDIVLQDSSSNISLTYESTKNTDYAQPWVSPQMDTSLSIFKVNNSNVTNGSTITLPYANSVTIIATPTQGAATVNVSGETGLTPGNNTLTVTVTALDGITVTQYTVTLNMLVLSADTSLSTFKIGGYSVTDGATLNLSYRTAINFDVVTTHPAASWAVVGMLPNNNSVFDVSVGNNSITIRVIAEDGTTQQDYIVTVNIAASLGPLSWHDMLPDLNVDGTPLTNPAVNVPGERYYKHAFSTGSDSTVELFMRYEQFSLSKEKIITGIYKVGNSTNLIGDQIQSPPLNTLYRVNYNVGYFTNGTYQYGLSPSVTDMDYSNYGGPDTLLFLESSSSYYIISKTNENNSIAATNGIYELDIALRDSTGNNLDLTYESTQNTAYTEPWSSSGPTPPPTGAPINVEVNFEVTIEGDSALSIFGQAAHSVANVLVAEMALPVNALYDSVNNKGLIEFWEPRDDQGNIACQLANTNSASGLNLTGAYKETLKQLAKGLQRVLCSKFDCVGVASAKAVPFNDAKYAGKVEYTTQRDFGRVAIACFAHYLFGHVDATAAITNEVAFVKSMLSLTESGADAAAVNELAGGAAARYAAYNADHLDDINNKELSAWNVAATNSDANLAKRLTAAIVGKGLDATGAIAVSKVKDDTLSAAEKKTKLAYIVAQVAGQDGTRLMNEDNSARTSDQHVLLRFYEGDVIYMNVKLLKPTVTVGGGQVGGVTSTALGNSYDDGTSASNVQSYTLKITLGPADTL